MVNKLIEIFKNKWEIENGYKMPIEAYWTIRDIYNNYRLVDAYNKIKIELCLK